MKIKTEEFIEFLKNNNVKEIEITTSNRLIEEEKFDYTLTSLSHQLLYKPVEKNTTYFQEYYLIIPIEKTKEFLYIHK